MGISGSSSSRNGAEGTTTADGSGSGCINVSSGSSSSNGGVEGGGTAAADGRSEKKRKFDGMSRDELINALVNYEAMIESQDTNIETLSKRNAVEDAVQVAYYVGKIAGEKIKNRQ